MADRREDGSAVAERRSASESDADDGKRAKRAQRRQEKAEKKLQEQRERAEQERLEEERAAAIQAMRERERKETERAERERARLERARELQEQHLRAQEERLEQRRRERAGLQEEKRREEAERRAERERREREEALRKKREASLREERERAARMHARRKQMEQAGTAADEGPQLKPIPVPDESPAPKVVPAPEARKTPPSDVRPVPRHSLKWPTLKVGLALAAITAAAFGAGTLLGLPLPSLGSDSGSSNSSSLVGDTLLLGAGTPASLTKGPFQPVAGPIDFGERDAKFGAPRSGHKHEGQDMFAKKGTPLVSVRDGIVVDRGKVNGRYSGGRGNYLAIYSPFDDRSFVYFHLLEPPPVFIGDEVRAGQQIGQMGCTGTCFGTHLHFEIRIGEARLRAKTKAVDPLPYLRQWPQAPAAASKPPAQ